ncbi:LPXTG cell wall anchor domain-containing protein [Microbacterium testaceum]|nr:LPXTG cell wall anchor domain-containing protein [Microbacterium testaceum]
MKRNMKRVGWAGASAALALAATGFIAPTAAFAGDAESTAPTSGPQFDAAAKALLSSDDQVKIVGADGNGNVVVYTTADEANLKGEPRAFVDNNANVILKKLDSAPKKAASTDVVGGAGYFGLVSGNSGYSCSVGFSGFTPTGAPAVISAGHCTQDGEIGEVSLTVPRSDTAGGGGQGPVELSHTLGDFGFSQFGGPGNTAGADGAADSVDISVIDITNKDLDLKPEVTDWTNVDDLSASTFPIKSVGEAQVGPFAKSGRTTGYTQGNIEIVNGWLDVEGRWVHGFGGPIDVIQGDSGGPMWQGDKAVGVTSALFDYQGVRYGWGADLLSGLAQTDGYTVEVQVDAPKLTTEDGSTVTTGSNISGTAQANTKLVVTPEKGDAFTIDVDGSGNWSFAVPERLGEYAFTLQSTSGYSKSSTVDASVNVVPQAPAFTSPADGSSTVSEVTKISGTGLAGATVTLTGDVKATAKVGADSTWSVEADLNEGSYKVNATQARDGVTSASASVSFAVIPAQPTIDGIVDGSSYSDSAIPTKVSGTGETGADITVSLNGAEVGTTTVKSGKWTVAFADALAPGDYTVVATQTVNGQSNSTSVSFSVAAAPGPSPSPSPSTPSTPGPTPGPQGTLPKTGASDPAPLALGAAALLLGGLGAVGYRRFRRVSR